MWENVCFCYIRANGGKKNCKILQRVVDELMKNTNKKKKLEMGSDWSSRAGNHAKRVNKNERKLVVISDWARNSVLGMKKAMKQRMARAMKQTTARAMKQHTARAVKQLGAMGKRIRMREKARHRRAHRKHQRTAAIRDLVRRKRKKQEARTRRHQSIKG